MSDITISKEPRLKGPCLGLPPEGLERSFPSCGSLLEWWSIAKYQIPSTKSQGVRCRVSGVREEKQTN